MPDSFGKRKRRDVKAKKAAAREERRVARARRREDRAAGLIEPGTRIEANEPEDLFGPSARQPAAAEGTEQDEETEPTG